MNSSWLRPILPALVCRSSKLPWNLIRPTAAVGSGVVLAYILTHNENNNNKARGLNLLQLAATVLPRIYAAEQTSDAVSSKDDIAVAAKKKSTNAKTLRGRKMRKKFLSYATVLHEGTAYMTCEDFILALVEGSSVLEKNPNPRTISDDDKKAMLKKVPALKKGSKQLFRSLGPDSLISFPEFIFLLCALTRSERGFKIGFQMLDEDGNGNIDLAEFRQLTALMGHAYGGSAVGDAECQEDSSTFKNSTPNTTVATHLFGQNGKGILPYEKFKIFVDNLWMEMLEVEYENAADPATKQLHIVDFGKIVLRYTHFDNVEQQIYLNSLREKETQSISFEEFCQFNHFLSHLEDFRLSMHMYSVAGVSVTPEELERAIFVSCGIHFSKGLLELLYAVFDINQDQKLSYREFVSVLHDRLNRSLRTASQDMEPLSIWEQWKKCVRQENRRNL